MNIGEVAGYTWSRKGISFLLIGYVGLAHGFWARVGFLYYRWVTRAEVWDGLYQWAGHILL